ncbi:hypothetical protein FGIG_08327 [Fasciola gigantica]|uniref:Rubisco LSMT substrate-binding domain-containing protein n=1 Tax=Fasciola gigantica TaxID=46835 RepID=A0A504YFP0_FASGI|nr:hypothetical protein FGIG_08327 [Fasciola gigantica]
MSTCCCFFLSSPLQSAVSLDPTSLKELIAFARVFVMTKDQLEHHLSHPDSATEIVRNTVVNRTLENDLNAVDFLVKRFGLLIVMYGPLLEENDEQHVQFTIMEQNCARLKQQEIAILRSCIATLNAMTSEPSDPALISDSLSITDAQCNLTPVPSSSEAETRYATSQSS